MSEFDSTPRSHSGALLAAVGVALLAAVAGLIWSYTLSSRLSTQEVALTDAKQQNVKLAAELRETDARLKVATEELGSSLGITQKSMDNKAQEIMRREQANEASAKTQSELATTISQLMSIKGDLSDHSSLIARNHDELEILKHKGDRNYYEFTLNKGEKKPVGTVSLELKKTDAKKGKMTLMVYADDKKYEKKDRNVNEPLQFYAGKTPMLYEIVVNSINSKNQITGYLATPKGAPTPISQ